MKKKHLNILYLTQYYPPEIGATQTRAHEMARHLVRKGHRVTVLAEFPNHPLGIVTESYRRKLFTRSRESGVDVIRVWVAASPKKNFLTRMALYLSYMTSAAVAGAVLRNRYDLVFATSPPLFTAAAGRFIAAVKQRPFFMEVRDLWPESAVVLGELKNPRIIRMAERLEEALYRKASAVIGVTEGITERLESRGVPSGKIILIPNGANTELYRPGRRDPKLLESLGIPADAFVVIYTGLHGLMHGLNFVLDTACSLQDESVFFLFIGDGVRKPHLVRRAGDLNLSNTVFLEGQSEEALPAYLHCADAGLVTTRKMAFCRGTLPVKLFTYMACAVPVLLCAEGEARTVLDRAGAGLAAGPEDMHALRKAVLDLKADEILRRSMGRKGRRFVQAHYSRKRFADALENCFIKKTGPYEKG